MILNISAIQKLEIIKPGIIAATRSTIKALITRVKRPKVKMLIGSVRTSNKGRITALTTPKTKATKSPAQKPLTLAPGISQALIKIAAVLINQVMSSFMCLLLFNNKINYLRLVT